MEVKFGSSMGTTFGFWVNLKKRKVVALFEILTNFRKLVVIVILQEVVRFGVCNSNTVEDPNKGHSKESNLHEGRFLV